MESYKKLPSLFWIVSIIGGEYVMVKLLTDRDSIPFDKLSVVGDCKYFQFCQKFYFFLYNRFQFVVFQNYQIISSSSYLEFIFLQIFDELVFKSQIKQKLKYLDFYHFLSVLKWISTSNDFNMGFLGWFLAIHSFEAMFAWQIASLKNLNISSRIFWFGQTAILGFSSFEQLCEHPAV